MASNANQTSAVGTPSSDGQAPALLMDASETRSSMYPTSSSLVSSPFVATPFESSDDAVGSADHLLNNPDNSEGGADLPRDDLPAVTGSPSTGADTSPQGYESPLLNDWNMERDLHPLESVHLFMNDPEPPFTFPQPLIEDPELLVQLSEQSMAARIQEMMIPLEM